MDDHSSTRDVPHAAALPYQPGTAGPGDVGYVGLPHSEPGDELAVPACRGIWLSAARPGPQGHSCPQSAAVPHYE